MDNLPESWVFMELASERGTVGDLGLFCFYSFVFDSVNQNTPFLDCWRLAPSLPHEELHSKFMLGGRRDGRHRERK